MNGILTNGHHLPLVDTAELASDALSPSSPSSSSVASSFVAPLGSDFDEISLDGTSFSSDSLRAERPEDVTEEDRERAKIIKSEANKHFGMSNFVEALDLYTASLNINPFDPATWCNSELSICPVSKLMQKTGAQVRIKREEFGLAIYDAGKAIELDAKYVKAYYRRALANLSVLQPKKALVDFKKLVALDPKNTAAKAQLDSTIKLVRKMDFEKA